MQPGRALTSGLGVPLLPLARWVGWVAPVRPTHGVLVLFCPPAALRVCSVLGRLPPVHRCAHVVCCVASAVSWSTWLLFTGVLARCVVLRVRCPGPLGSRSPVRPLGVLCCVCGVPGHWAPVHGEPAQCVALRVRCPGVRFSCNLYFRFFQCIFLIYLYNLKSAISALFWTVLVSVDQEFL